MARISMLNRVELIGQVDSIRTGSSAGKQFANFTVATNVCYKSSDGTFVIDTTWTQVSAFEDKSVDFKGLQKGSYVHVIGRLRNMHYTAEDGTQKTVFDVLASTVEKIEADGMQCETLNEN